MWMLKGALVRGCVLTTFLCAVVTWFYKSLSTPPPFMEAEVHYAAVAGLELSYVDQGALYFISSQISITLYGLKLDFICVYLTVAIGKCIHCFCFTGTTCWTHIGTCKEESYILLIVSEDLTHSRGEQWQGTGQEAEMENAEHGSLVFCPPPPFSLGL